MPMKIEKTGERDTSTRTLVVYGELTGLEPRVKAYTTTKRYRTRSRKAGRQTSPPSP
jgi:hypothetical protein